MPSDGGKGRKSPSPAVGIGATSLDEALMDVMPAEASGQTARGGSGTPADDGDALWNTVLESEILDALQKAVVDIVDRVRTGVKEDVKQLLEQRLGPAGEAAAAPSGAAGFRSPELTLVGRGPNPGAAVVKKPLKGHRASIGSLDSLKIEKLLKSDDLAPVVPGAVPVIKCNGTDLEEEQRPGTAVSQKGALKNAQVIVPPEPPELSLDRARTPDKKPTLEKQGTQGSFASNLRIKNRMSKIAKKSYFAMHELGNEDIDPRISRAEGHGGRALRSIRETGTVVYRSEGSAWVSDDSTCSDRTKRWQRVRAKAIKIVRHKRFDSFVSFVTVMNAISIGLQTNYMSSHIGQSVPIGFRIAEWLFLMAFILELVARWIVYGRRLFSGSARRWVMLDFSMVAVQLVEEMLSAVAHIWNLSILRGLLFIRLIRIMRVIRVCRLIVEFRTMVSAMGCAIRPWLSALFLVVILIYIVSVYVVQMLIESHHDNPTTFEDNEGLQKYWRNMGIAMLTLCKTVQGGLWWNALLDPLDLTVSGVMTPLFLCYMAFAQYVLMNITNGVVYELTFRNLKENRDRELITSIMEVFMDADADDSGKISWEEFRGQLHNPLMEKYFKVIDLDISEAKALFDLLDVSGEGDIDAADFVMGCLRLRGSARAFDLTLLSRDMDTMYQNTQKSIAEVMNMLVDVHMAVKTQVEALTQVPAIEVGDTTMTETAKAG